MTRPAIAHIRLDAFRHNYQLAKKMHGGKALAVIKANAYGHGAVQCAKAIENEADGFAVACLEEAIQLRQASIKNPILLLEGFFEAAELVDIVKYDFWMVIHAQWQLDIFLATTLSKPVHVWLKMDSGMHRVGLSSQAYSHAYKILSGHQNVEKIVLMSHFANADNVELQHTLHQIALFEEATSKLNTENNLEAKNNVETSLANSAAILAWPQSHANWARPGIMLYGADPHFSTEFNLRAVMQLTARIISIREINQGESFGYGSIFTAEQAMKIGVVSCGYADGYPRSAINAPVAVDGMMTRVIGRVSMDMLFVDLTHVTNAKIGSLVELWGDQVSANSVAKAAGTIAYELFCNVKRVQFHYTDI